MGHRLTADFSFGFTADCCVGNGFTADCHGSYGFTADYTLSIRTSSSEMINLAVVVLLSTIDSI